MVIPWVGFPLGDLLKQVEPTSKAKYVAFTTLLPPAEMPGSAAAALRWPYVEGLRLDEAMHPLTLLAVGPLRQDAAEPERRADPAGRAVEVRLQEHQVDRARSGWSRSSRRPAGTSPTPQSTASTRTSTRGRSPALDAGARAPHRRVPAPADADVQRLRRSGGEPLRRAWT